MKWIMSVLLPVLFLSVWSTGCDQGSSHYELTITPEEKELTYNSQTVRFEVTDGLRDLSVPLRWEVSNPAIGRVVAHEGVSAIYQRTGPGVNILTAIDQYGAEGIASISSPGGTGSSSTDYSLVLVANPSETIPVGVQTVTITVVNGRSPYTWSVGNASLGAVPAGDNDDSVVYTSTTNGQNTVICVDANSARGTLTVTQE